MAIAIAIVIIVVASVLFHFVSPWWATPLASNWKQMDDTLTITLVITGIFFIVINLFIAYIVWRYRHREGARAAYQPENSKLELWLIAGTTLGIAWASRWNRSVCSGWKTPRPPSSRRASG
ncbi:cytochrome c oxidase subunit II [Cupriavidus basilensis OR16]|uniref:Cytochrome c oxidase subunit II n=1 Tax=Cupriavidus basilensis OR16 TaxID=1127483 RepID=H1SGN9_9BURK|nr:cytochrome c oxidase subunit II [Cupriavidus basilensis OR16]